MEKKRERAKQLLVHYFKLQFDRNPKLVWGNDNKVEIEEIVDQIFDGIEEEITAIEDRLDMITEVNNLIRGTYNMNKNNYIHLGDGAYAHFNGHAIEIMVNDHRNEPVAVIPLEGIDTLKNFKDQRVNTVKALKRLGGSLEKGSKVTYCPDYGENKKGKVKSFDEEDYDYAFVVFNCADNWDNFTDYTVARTPIVDLKKGWEASYD